jgi:hypothetical protein
MRYITKLTSLFGVLMLLAAFFVVTNFLPSQAQDTDIVGTWSIEDEVTDAMMIFHADGTVTSITEFSLLHPDTVQLGIWWQDGDVIYWMARGFSLSGETTVVVNVTGTVEMNGSDAITVDPLVKIPQPDGTIFTDDAPPAAGTRMQADTDSAA